MANKTGTTASEILYGTSSSDTLDGAAGNDTLIGYAGNDTYAYSLGTGNDTIIDSSGADTLALDDPNNLFSTWNFTRSGNDLVVDFGSAGQVTIKNEFANSSSLVIDKVSTPDDETGGTYSINIISSATTGTTSDDLIIGTSASNTIQAYTGDDQIFAGAGNDSINGGLGHDYFYGGLGSDTINGGSSSSSNTDWDESSYIIDTKGVIANLSENSIVSSGISVASNRVYQYVDGSTDTLLNIDGIEGSNYADKFYASSKADLWFGGMNGNDTFYASASLTTWHEFDGGNGSDTVSYELTKSAVNIDLRNDTQQYSTTYGYADQFDSIENVTGSNYADKLWGNTAGNKISGLNGNDMIYGRDGNDTITGGNGIDTIDGGYGNDIIDGGADNDTISGYYGNDNISGGSGNDTIIGELGNDTLTGGTGKDYLTGGAGNDVFNFDAVNELTTSGSTTDYIQDFVHGTDKIDLSGIDANTSTSADNAFTTLLSSSASFTAAGQLKYEGGVLYGNTDNDSAAEFAIHLTGTPTITLSDFIL